MTSPRVLLAEDQFLIGIDLCDELEARGFRILGPLASIADTLAAIEAEAIDAAILDIRLQDGSGFELARRLRSRGVPFVFYSGHTETSASDRAEFAGAPWVGKPAGMDAILAALAAVLRPVAKRIRQKRPRTDAERARRAPGTGAKAGRPAAATGTRRRPGAQAAQHLVG
jgi:DNA-binding response OmpR family regulator